MTTDALGPCPPPMGVFPKTCREQLVTAAYADWQRFRAERAEELLRDAIEGWNMAPAISDRRDRDNFWAFSARVAAHFASVKGEKP